MCSLTRYTSASSLIPSDLPVKELIKCTLAGLRGTHKETKYLEALGDGEQQGLSRGGSQAYISAQDLKKQIANSSESSWWQTIIDSLAGFPQVGI